VSDNQPTTRQLAALFVVIAVATTIVLGVVTLRGGGPGGHTGPGASSALAARSNARSGVAGAASGARQRATSTTADLPAPTPSTAPVTTAPVTTAPVTTTPVTTTSVTTAPVTAPATVVPTTATTTLTRLGSGNGPPASLDVPTGSALAPLGPPAPGWRTAVALGGSGTGRSSVFTMTGHDSQVRLRSSAAMLRVFVVDETRGRDATGGFADAECGSPCSDVVSLTLRQGTYHLEVESAGGPWEAAIEELGASA